MDFTNKTAIVTGSARGIGKVIAEELAKAGANIVISDLDEALINQVVTELAPERSASKQMSLSPPISIPCSKKSSRNSAGLISWSTMPVLPAIPC
jgi:NAD(P)-dependent dehydrogenase (short-subunit alcohol dehydrogenase family)